MAGRFALRPAVSTVVGWFAPPTVLTNGQVVGRYTLQPGHYSLQGVRRLIAPQKLDATTDGPQRAKVVLGAFRTGRLAFP